MQKLEEWNPCPLQSNSLDSEAMHCSLSFVLHVSAASRVQTIKPNHRILPLPLISIYILALGYIII